MTLSRPFRLTATLALALLACALIACGGAGSPAQIASPGAVTTPSTPATTLAISTTDLPIASMGQSYAAALNATGSTGAVKWSVLSGALPAGVSLAETGALSGTPIASGVFNVAVRASDSVASVSRTFTVHVSGNGTFYHRYTKPGVYNVTVTKTDAQGNTASATQTIVVSPSH
jgi:putative Ig domain-containing protein